MRARRATPSVALVALAVAAQLGSARAGDAPAHAAAPCPPEMVHVHDFCVDRWEASMVDTATGQPLSPYYPPAHVLIRRVREAWESERRAEGSRSARGMPLPALPAWELERAFEPKAVSVAGAVPQGYLTYYLAKKACENAGKRLCTEDEWVTACKGARATRYPYGATFSKTACNVFRLYHPAFVLHDNSSIGHTDPRLNLVVEEGKDPVLRLTGATRTCASVWDGDRIYDMVGNLDEWVDDDTGVFVGGFYARGTTKGCEARVSNHSPAYYDYSLGTRCCLDARP